MKKKKKTSGRRVALSGEQKKIPTPKENQICIHWRSWRQGLLQGDHRRRKVGWFNDNDRRVTHTTAIVGKKRMEERQASSSAVVEYENSESELSSQSDVSSSDEVSKNPMRSLFSHGPPRSKDIPVSKKPSNSRMKSVVLEDDASDNELVAEGDHKDATDKDITGASQEQRGVSANPKGGEEKDRETMSEGEVVTAKPRSSKRKALEERVSENEQEMKEKKEKKRKTFRKRKLPSVSGNDDEAEIITEGVKKATKREGKKKDLEVRSNQIFHNSS